MDAKFIIQQLVTIHDPKMFAFFEELRIGGGYGPDSESRFDAWAIHYHPSKRNVTRCYEVKISRGDFFSELKKPKKRRPALRLSNEYYFVVPKGLVKTEEVPPDAGLIEVDESGKVEIVIPAPYRESIPTWNFLAALCRRVDKPRFLLSKEKNEAIKLSKEYAFLSRIILERHIEKWSNYSIGNKEVPDQIAEALKAALEEIDGIVKSNRHIDD